MTPWRWGGTPFADGCFPTPDGRARMVPIKQVAPAEPLARWPMTLNTGRYRDQWHSMTRTGLSPRLASHRREPVVEDRKSVVVGKGVSVRVDLGGSRRIKKKKKKT